MGGVSKIKVAGNDRGTKDSNFRAKITWFEERSEEKEYRIETNDNDAGSRGWMRKVGGGGGTS